MDKKYCSGCGRFKDVELFIDDYKCCDKCREKQRTAFRNYKENNPEEVKERGKQYREKKRDELIEKKKQYRESEEGQATIKGYRLLDVHCDVCDCDVRRKHKAKHESTSKHIENMRKSTLV